MKRVISAILVLTMVLSMSNVFALPLSAEEIVEPTPAVTNVPEDVSNLPEVTTAPEVTAAPEETTALETTPAVTETTEPIPEVAEPVTDDSDPEQKASEPEPEVNRPGSEVTEFPPEDGVLSDEPMFAATEDIVANGTCGDTSNGGDGTNLTWTLDSVGTLTISGSGKMGNYSYQNKSPFYKYRSQIKCVELKSGVISIGDYAFYVCDGLTSVTIPDSVTSIGYQSIYGCTGLTSVIIPGSVTSIGADAFRKCTGLTSVTISDGVTSISASAFSNCTGLTSVTIPSSVTSIDYHPFDGCASLTDIYCEAESQPSGWASDWKNGCSANVTWGCKKVCSHENTEIRNKKPAKTDEKGYTGDKYCLDCGELIEKGEEIPLRTEIIADGYCGETSNGGNGTNLIWTLDSAGTLTISGSGKMRDYDDNQNKSPFSGIRRSWIKCIIFRPGIISIGKWAFYGCTNLTTVTIPAGVTSIGYAAFEGCTSLTSIGVDSNNASYCCMDGVLLTNDKTQIICYPAGKKDAYYSIPTSVTSIENYAFGGCSGLTEVTIPDGVASIGAGAFMRCVGLTEVTIPDSVTSIGDYAFEECTGLTSVTIPGSVTSIDDLAFFGCSGLTSVRISNGVTSIGRRAFEGCSGLTEVTIPGSITSIGDLAFWYCTGLTEIIIPGSVTSIGGSMFDGCSNLTDIYCEAKRKPSGWDNGWNYGCSATVHWSHKNEYVVTYDANGGTGAPASQIKESGKVLTLSSVKPTREDYTFLGWATSADASSAHYNPGSSFTIDADTTLYAVWKKDEVVPEGQLDVGSVTARKGKTVEVPVVINSNPGVNAVTVTPVYNTSVMKLVSVKCSESSFSSELGKNIVILGPVNKETDGEFFVMVFEVLNDTQDGVYNVSLTFRDAAGISDGTVVERQLECVSGTVSVNSIVYGDANGDGKITTVDLSLLCIYIANYDYDTETSSVDVQEGADVNADGTIDTMDLSLLSIYVANYDYDLNESTIILGPKN